MRGTLLCSVRTAQRRNPTAMSNRVHCSSSAETIDGHIRNIFIIDQFTIEIIFFIIKL